MKSLKHRLGHLTKGRRGSNDNGSEGGSADGTTTAASGATPPATPQNLSPSQSIIMPPHMQGAFLPNMRSTSPSGGVPPPGVKMMTGPPPPGAKIINGPPPLAGAGLPPGAKLMSGPPPPGVKIMSGPPPGTKIMPGPLPQGVKMMSGPPPAGAHIVTPPIGAGPRTNTPPQGMKMISGPPPPGARIVTPPGGAGPRTGSPPQGMKLMSGPPPPGAKLIPSPSQRSVSPVAAPAPGTKFVSGPPPLNAKLVSGVQPGLSSPQHPGMKMMSGLPPPGAKVISGPPPPGAKIVNRPTSPGAMGGSHPSLPPGVKIMSGPPPPGVKLVKMPVSPEMSRASSPSLVSGHLSRTGTPEPGRISPQLRPGMKMMSGPPPPGAKLIKMSSLSPSRAQSPPHPQGPGVRPLLPVGPGGSHPLPPQQSTPTTPHLVGADLSFSVGGQQQQQLRQDHPSNLPRPTPINPKKLVKAPPVRASGTSLNIPQPAAAPPQALHGGSGRASSLAASEDEGEIQFNTTGRSSMSGDIQFESSPAYNDSPSEIAFEEDDSKKPPLPSRFHPRSSSSSMLKEDPDEGTQKPQQARPHKASTTVTESVKSFTILPKSASSSSTTSSSAPAGDKKNKERKRKKSRHHRHDEDDDGEENRKGRKHKKKRRHHRSSSEGKKRGKESSRGKRRSSKGDMSRDSLGAAKAKEGNSSSSSSSSFSSSSSKGVFQWEPKASASVPSSGLADTDFAPNFTSASMTPGALTPALRSRTAEQFLSILCPQQYYGKVKKISGIRPIAADYSLATGLHKSNSIYVATKGTMPNRYFYPQLRLLEADGQPVREDTEAGTLSTPIILYEAAPGNMMFADTELDARRVLETNAGATSCFVLSCSAIIFRDPAKYILPVAMLSVRWTPYASPSSEPQCSIHKKELQLFDPYSKELVCALCASKENAANYSKLIVIPDVLAGDSRRRIHESVSRQLDEAQRAAKLWVGQHQRVAQLAESKKEAINQQFRLLVAAIESKRKEFLESCDAEYGYALSDVAREILVCDEKTQLLAAATDHLRTDPSRPLYSMQIATIAEGLEASEQFPSTFSRSSLRLPGNFTGSGVMPNLESVMGEINALAPNMMDGGAAVNGGTSQKQRALRSGRSPVDSVLITENSKGAVAAASSPNRAASNRQSARHATFQHANGSLRESQRRSMEPERSASAAWRASPVAEEPRSISTPHRRAPRDPSSSYATPVNSKGGYGHRASRGTTEEDDCSALGSGGGARAYSVDAVSVPNSSGTSLFDYPLQQLLVDPSDPGRKLRPRCVQWTFRIDEPGDWVGIGVGVGTTIDAWERGRSNDLSHLWIVPYAGVKQTFLLRVTLQPTIGHAKLSIHDVRGKQLDDATIPQWSASRVCYPQVTFGGRVGQVRMTEMPHLI